MHERAFIRDIYSVEVSGMEMFFKFIRCTLTNLLFCTAQVKVICETRDWAHSEELRKLLTENYSRVVFNDVPMAIPPTQTKP